MEKLENDISWQYRLCAHKPKKWSFEGNEKLGYFFTEFLLNSNEANDVIKLLSQLGGGEKLPIEKVYAVYNPSLVSSFQAHRSTSERRVEKNPWSTEWKENDSTGLRQWVFQQYLDKVNQFPWNSDSKVPVIPVVHGTGMGIAWKIAKTGFAVLASLDSGFFGQGIYFTSSSLYSLPYSFTKEDPALIISYVIPGNVYPVIEQHQGEETLIGAAIKSPEYHSHYVITKKDGFACTQVGEYPIFDELVVAQEAQVVPAFIIQLGKTAELRQFYDQFSRDIPEAARPAGDC